MILLRSDNQRNRFGSGARSWGATLAVAGGVALGIAALAPVATAAPAGHRAVTAIKVSAKPAAPSISASCPAAPKRPAKSKGYKLNGYRWNPSETIKYVVDTARLPSSQVKARVSDARRAMREMAADTGLVVSYRGTETKLLDAMTHPRLVQFEYANISGGIGVKPNLYNYFGTKQMYSAVIKVQSTTVTGYGSYNRKHPERSAEGHLLLFGVGETAGLAPVKDTYREVMNGVAREHFYYNSFQRGDKYGLWLVGSSKGCGGFQH
jgi:hypothetical protein